MAYKETFFPYFHNTYMWRDLTVLLWALGELRTECPWHEIDDPVPRIGPGGVGCHIVGQDYLGDF